MLSNTYDGSEAPLVHSARQFIASLGEDVAASIRANFKANIAVIIRTLKSKKITGIAIARELKKDPTVIPQLANGTWFPSPEELDKLVEVLNRLDPDLKITDVGELYLSPKRRGTTPPETPDSVVEMLQNIAKSIGHRLVKDD